MQSAESSLPALCGRYPWNEKSVSEMQRKQWEDVRMIYEGRLDTIEQVENLIQLKRTAYIHEIEAQLKRMHTDPAAIPPASLNKAKKELDAAEEARARLEVKPRRYSISVGHFSHLYLPKTRDRSRVMVRKF